MTFSEEDKKFMKIALDEAKKTLEKDNYPVGAALVIDGELVATEANNMYAANNWTSHAEAELIKKHGKIIKESIKEEKSVEIYSTLEPCLMCLGTCILSRITRIVFACPDPHGGATKLEVSSLPPWYKKNWPVIESGLFREESYELLTTFMRDIGAENWKSVLELFEKERESWN